MQISIIIPVYNAALYLHRCLDSVLAQTYDNWEAICIDDGSSDSSPFIIEEYVGKDRRFKLVIQKNGGAGKARNEGLKQAVGDYVFFIDSDDELAPHCLQVMMDEVKFRQDVDMVVARNLIINGIVNRMASYGNSCYIEDNARIRFMFFSENTRFNVVPWNRLIKRRFLEENNIHFMEGVICEDEYWSFYLYKNLNKMSIIDDVTYYHHICPTSVMSLSDKQMRANALFLILNDLLKDFGSPMRSLQVFKGLEYFRIHVLPYVPKKKTKRLYFGFFRELMRIGQFRIALYWWVNWYRDYKHFQFYYKMIPEAYHAEEEKCKGKLEIKDYEF